MTPDEAIKKLNKLFIDEQEKYFVDDLAEKTKKTG